MYVVIIMREKFAWLFIHVTSSIVQEAFNFLLYMFVVIKLPVLAWELMLGFISGGQDIYPPQHIKGTRTHCGI